ncbi:MAG: isoleucine--tRNA ligase [Thermoplasmata archaeon]|nr:isoleucine--tRNA ligase [Thermoplasmata archaeon]
MATGEGEHRPAPVSFAEIGRRVRTYWESAGVPDRVMAGHPGGPVFRFTEGPPTANGAPHVGHVVSRALKDVHLRYHRMRGDRIVTSMAGWDCHGLPVEIEVEKRHGIRSKKEIEAFGVARFCEECRQSTLEVAAVWEEMSRRLGYWLDYRHPYLTMSAPYIESVWWSLKQLHEKGLLEKGHYVLPYCPRCETPLSSHEVAQGYKETTDPSVTVRFRLKPTGGEPPASLLVWTTTPWTLPANLLVAANAGLTYVGVRGPDGGEEILAEAAVPRYFPNGAEVLHHYDGSELAGREYEPPFPFAGPASGRYRVVLDAMVDPAEGTGVVHIAPSFGPEDQRIGAREGVGVYDPLDSRAVFTSAVPLVVGKSFKAADPLLTADLEARGLLAQKGSVRHTYPFCWRCGNPLIYRAIDSWFVRTSRFNEPLVRHNQSVTWIPEHLRDGRFGNFLTEAKDWAVSRNRFWGTPLPVWVCPVGHATCVGSFAELERLSHQKLPDGFDPHRVGVDPIRMPCTVCGAEAKREPYTIDGWYDSGAAPFAQYHYPFEPGPFDPAAPLDFVAEGLDQTRGWFYTMLVLSTGLFDRPAYRVAIANGLVLDDSGQKMSKSKGNVVEPLGLLEKHGGDVVRWAFFTADYTEPTKLHESDIGPGAARVLGTLLNVLAFYRQNASADGLAPARVAPKPAGLLDRWLLSRLDETIRETTRALDEYDPRAGAGRIREFVDDLSTWYLRRSRPRFWSETDVADRRVANDTLSYALSVTTRLLAPFAPFTAEHLHQELHELDFSEASESVHLARWPSTTGHVDGPLNAAMAALRAEVEVGRELRQRAVVKSRIPLETFAVFSDALSPLGTAGDQIVADELNVRVVVRLPPANAGQFSDPLYVVRSADRGAAYALSAKPTAELHREGLIRESLRRFQQERKAMGLAFTDHVEISVFAEGDLAVALGGAKDRLASELLADSVELVGVAPAQGSGFRDWDIEGMRLSARIRRVGA